MSNSILKHTFGCGRILMTLALVAGSVFTAGNTSAENVPISVLDTDQRRAIVARVQMDATGGASPVDVLISEVPPRMNIGDPPQMRVESLDANGNVLSSRNAWDPLWEFVHTEAGGEQAQMLEQAMGVFEVPFDAAVRSVRIFRQAQEDDGVDTLLTDVDVAAVVDAFCAVNPSDPGCAGINRPPIADAGGPYAVASGASLLLDGRGSFDPEGDPVTFNWDLDEDGVLGETGASAVNGEEVGDTPLFNAPELSGGVGIDVAVVLEVCDGTGGCDGDTAVVTVLPPQEENDADGDGVVDLMDICPETLIPEAAPLSGQLGSNRWALTGPGQFEQGSPKRGVQRPFTLSDTAGCSCTQILDGLGITSQSHREKGCPTGLMVRWTEQVAP